MQTTEEIYYGYEVVPVSGSMAKARELINQGWRATYTELFGQHFIDGLAPHHIEAIEWHWISRIAFLEGFYPEFDAYFPIWSRAHNKSGVARRVAIVDGFLSYAYGQPAFILYLSRNKLMVKKHAKSVETLLQSKRIKNLCPELATVQRNDQRQSKGWTEAFFYTQANVIFQFAGLDEGLAGGNLETNINEENSDGEETQSDVRVTFFVPDDIDGREESPTIAEARFNTLTTEVLPMGQENSLVFFAQNLINRYSTMYRIYKQQDRVLTGRKPTEPIKAVLNLVTEERTVNGIVRDVYVSGTPTWHVWDARRIQREINRYGLESFKKECQHEVEQAREGLVHKKYDDNVHPISYSQFAAVYGSPDAWKSWFKVPFSDWSRTKTKYHANVAGYLAVSSQNTRLPGLTFCLPVSFKADTMPEDVAERLLTMLTPYAYGDKRWRDLIDEAWKRVNAHEYFKDVSERITFTKSYYTSLIAEHSRKVLAAFHVKTGANSHSEDKVRSMFNDGFGFDFIASNPGKTDALEDIDAAQRVDYNEPHLFDDSKMGYTRWYVLCRDDKTKEPKIINGIEVYPPVPYPVNMKPDDLHDEDLFRHQFCNRRFLPPELHKLGERIDEPEKAHDDFGQALQMVYLKKLLANFALTRDEMVEERMPDELSQEAVAQYYGEEGFAELMVARLQNKKQIEIRLDEERREEQENLRRAFGGGSSGGTISGGRSGHSRVRLLGNRRR